MEYLNKIKMLQGRLNTSEYARFLGVPQQTLNYLLKGERKLSVELLVRICEKHHVSADYILGIDSPVLKSPQNGTEQQPKIAEINNQNDNQVIQKLTALKIENKLLREEIERLHSTIVAMNTDYAVKKGRDSEPNNNITSAEA